MGRQDKRYAMRQSEAYRRKRLIRKLAVSLCVMAGLPPHTPSEADALLWRGIPQWKMFRQRAITHLHALGWPEDI